MCKLSSFNYLLFCLNRSLVFASVVFSMCWQCLFYTAMMWQTSCNLSFYLCFVFVFTQLQCRNNSFALWKWTFSEFSLINFQFFIDKNLAFLVLIYRQVLSKIKEACLQDLVDELIYKLSVNKDISIAALVLSFSSTLFPILWYSPCYCSWWGEK